MAGASRITYNQTVENASSQPALAPGYGPNHPSAPSTGASRLTPAQTRVLRALASQREPTTLADLSASTSLHPNTVREHLGALESHGLVARSRAIPTGRGRPAWQYSVIPGDADPLVAEYAGLAATLAGALRQHSPDPARDAVAAGRTWGSELARRSTPPTSRTSLPVRQAAVELLGELRFAPETGPAATVVRLTRCPLLTVAEQYPDIVCSVHQGLVEGALEQWGDSTTRVELTPFAQPGACVLILTPHSSAPRR